MREERFQFAFFSSGLLVILNPSLDFIATPRNLRTIWIETCVFIYFLVQTYIHIYTSV